MYQPIFFNVVFRAAFLFAAAISISCSAQTTDPVPNDPPLRWWKGNLHTHSLWSDGNDFPEMIAEWYRIHDYNFLALSDHNVLSEGLRWMKYSDIVSRNGANALQKYRLRFGDGWVESQGQPDSPEFKIRLKPLNEFRALVEERGRFIMIQGEEISDRSEGKPVHMNASNLRDTIQPSGGATVRETIENNFRAVEDQAKRLNREILLHINHPNFGLALTAEDLASVAKERFFEVYNGHPGVKHLGDMTHPGVERLWDIANSIRLGQLGSPAMYGIATDDSHKYHGMAGSHPGRGWIMVRSRYLTPEHLIRAIKSGDFYATSGITLVDVGMDESTQTLTLEIEPVDGVSYTTQFIGTLSGFDSASEPYNDEHGAPLKSTRKYSADIGKVLATVKGLHPQYKLNGDELYVRAVVTSNQPPADPSFKGQMQQCWTQPVGWEK